MPKILVLVQGGLNLLSRGKDEFEEDREGAVHVHVLYEEVSITLLHKCCEAGDLALQVGEFAALKDVNHTPEEH